MGTKELIPTRGNHVRSNQTPGGVRIVGEISRAQGVLFGHYDSRGGATLQMGGLHTAIVKYAEAFGGKEEEWAIPSAEEDVEWWGEVIVVGKSLDEGELLSSYRGEQGWRVGWLEHRNKYTKNEWEPTAIVVWEDVEWTKERDEKEPDEEGYTKYPTPAVNEEILSWVGTEYRIRDISHDLGEDAFGCLFQE